MAKKKKSSARSSRCVRKKIVIKGKRGGIKATFMGRTGPGCGPRSNKTSAKGHEVRRLLAKAGKQCGAKFGYFTKASGKCVRDAFKTSYR